MKFIALISYLMVVGTAQATLAKTEETTTKTTPANVLLSNHQENAESKVTTRKREIPDALVDRPEEFESEEEVAKDQTPSFINEVPEGEVSPILDTSTLDEDAEYPNEEADERKKRTVEEEESKRSKRNLRTEDNNYPHNVLQVLEVLNQNYIDGPSNEDDWDGPTAEDSDRAANAVLEALGFGPNAAKYWPEGPPNTDELIPIAKVRVPFNRRPVL